MTDFKKVFLERILVSAVNALATYLVTVGWLTESQTQGFIGAVFFLVAWLVDTFIVRRGKERAAIKGGEAVARAASDDFTAPEVKAIVKDAHK